MNSILINFDDNTDINAVYNHLKKLYPESRIVKNAASVNEMLEDEYLLTLAEKRLKSDSGVRHSHEDIMRMHGITREELDEVPMEYGVDFE